MKMSVPISNLTLELWQDFVRPALRAANMLAELPFKYEHIDYTAEVIEETIAKEIAFCMRSACFNAHSYNGFSSFEEAKWMIYQLDVSSKYSPATSEAMNTLREAICKIIEHWP